LSRDEDIKNDEYLNSVNMALGNVKLGHDMIPGRRVTGFIGKLIVTIGPVTHTNIAEFFDEGRAGSLLKSFYSYFIPVELDVETKILTEDSSRNFILGMGEEYENSYLGYNTVL
jgi:predicted component of type VI protein secretion system